MKILLTKTNGIFSKLIMSITKEDCSHISIEFPELGVVCHANMLGVHLEWSKNFRKKNILVDELVLNPDFQTEERLGVILERYEFKPYDFIVFLYTGLNIIFKGLLNTVIQQEIGSPYAFTCTEFVEEFFNLDIKFPTTPRQLFDIIKNKYNL